MYRVYSFIDSRVVCMISIRFVWCNNTQC